MTDAICGWARGSGAARRFHDDEWGAVIDDDQRLLELIALGITMAGLSFAVALAFRERMRAAFAMFDPTQTANLDDAALDALIESGVIVRNPVKARAIRANAAALVRMRSEGASLAALIAGAAEVESDEGAAAALASSMRANRFDRTGPALASFLLGAAGGRPHHDLDCVAAARAR